MYDYWCTKNELVVTETRASPEARSGMIPAINPWLIALFL